MELTNNNVQKKCTIDSGKYYEEKKIKEGRERGTGDRRHVAMLHKKAWFEKRTEGNGCR